MENKYKELFKKPWCPLFGELPFLSDGYFSTSNTTTKNCIVNILRARSIWGTDNSQKDYPGWKLKAAQDIFEKARSTTDDTSRNDVFPFARKITEPKFDHLSADYHALAIIAISEAWGTLEDMLRCGRQEFPEIAKRMYNSNNSLSTAKELMAGAEQINLKETINTLEAIIKHDEGLIRKTLKAANDFAVSVAQESKGNIFRKMGDFWEVKLENEANPAQINNTKGMGYIAYLLKHPNKEVPVSELVSEVYKNDFLALYSGSKETILKKMGISEEDARQIDLNEIINYPEVYESLTKNNHMEKLRKRVWKCITDTLQKLKTSHKPLFVHLNSTINFGANLSYKPQKAITWNN